MIATEPRIEGSASARLWQVSFMDELVKITVNRLVDEPKSLWGEWTIKANFPGLPNKWMEIHHEGFNLLSSAKQRLAKSLTVQYLATPWTTIVGKAAKLVIERHRAGEPAIQIKDVPLKENLSYRLAPLLLENQPTLLGEASALRDESGLVFSSPLKPGAPMSDMTLTKPESTDAERPWG